MKEFRELYIHHIGRVEELVGRLLYHKYESAQGMWLLQTDLARYQIELRKAVREEEAFQRKMRDKIAETVSRRDGGWKETIQELQVELRRSAVRINILEHAFALSRQFGDSLAWLFLKGDERRITALAINKPNPPIPDGLSLQAMLSVAENFANAGAGFPLIP